MSPDRKNKRDEPGPTAAEPAEPGTRGLARRIAKAGYATRRQAEEMVRSGRVRVDGMRRLDPYMTVTMEQEIVIDGVEMTEIIRAYYAFNKPETVSTHPMGHYDRLLGDFLPRTVPGIRPAGRLDAGTTGLLLLSNDSAWNAAAASGHGFDKEFLVTVTGIVSDNQAEVMAAGVQLPRAGYLHPTLVRIESRYDHNSIFRIALPGAKVRQIRALCAAMHLNIERIHRVRIGPIKLELLKAGSYRALSQFEIEGIREGV
ncbi:rRNA pseudouridine synthase [bacterium]|nr:rRNA pseudouridine synthase [bacterium]